MEDEKRYYVYMHIFPNDKKYIGITCRKPEYRWGKNGVGYKPNNDKRSSKIWNAIQKYGWDNVNHEILYENLSKEDACDKECELINYYQTRNDEFGYNIAFGGGVQTIPDETRLKISQSRKGKNYGYIGENAPMYGKHHTEETKEKIREAMLGKNNPFYGKCHSDETKRKEIIAHFDQSKSVDQYDKDGNLINSYVSIRDASRKTGINRRCIMDALNGVQKTAGGYLWKKSDVSSVIIFNQMGFNFITP